MYAYTASNRTLPFGTIVKVTNLKNNKSVQVRVNDRGPTTRSRIIDLSYQAAKDIGLIHDGIVPVKIETISLPSQLNTSKESHNPYFKNEKSDQEYMREYASNMPEVEKSLDYKEYLPFTSKKNKKENTNSNAINVQVATFGSRKNADSFINTQRDSGYNMKVIEVKKGSNTLYKVVVVCESAELVTRIIQSKHYIRACILKP